MHRYYCTYFDKNYLVKALAMMASLSRESCGPFTIYAVCLDELTRTLVNRLNLPQVVTIALHEIEQGDRELLAAKKTRSTVEYYWTLTPSVLLWILKRHQEIGLLTYLDADLYFYGSPEPIFAEFGDRSVLIHGHRFPEMLKHLEIYGKFNVGLLCFRRDAAGLETLAWWRERCNEWCYDHIEDGRYGDQLYLDDWTERFRGVHVLEHIGAGVAPWNHIQYRFRTRPSGRVAIDDQEVIFYHFHSLDIVRPELIVPAKHLQYPLREDIIRCCVTPYVKELCSWIPRVREHVADFSFGLHHDRPLAADLTIVAAKGYAQDLAAIGFDHPKIDLGGGWECHVSRQTQPTAPPFEPSRELAQDVPAREKASLDPGAAPGAARGPQVTVATSIAPKNLEQQRAALASWQANGFRVVSVNSPAEIAELAPHFPDVGFLEAQRDGRAAQGRPLIFLDDILAALDASGSQVCGIVNSDIHLACQPGFRESVAGAARDSLVFGHRVDVDSLEAPQGQFFQHGFDYFFFDRKLCALVPAQELCLGATWWDIWFPLLLILKDVPVKLLLKPVAYHVKHENKWDEADWQGNCLRVVESLERLGLAGTRHAGLLSAIAPQLRDKDYLGFYGTLRDYIAEHSLSIPVENAAEPAPPQPADDADLARCEARFRDNPADQGTFLKLVSLYNARGRHDDAFAAFQSHQAALQGGVS